jgi:3-oxoacyl-[acyl-carrier protein] reductase
VFETKINLNLKGTSLCHTSVKLHGKISIITGSGRGIGKAIAKRFASEGSSLVLASRSEKELNATLKEIISTGGIAIAVPTDISVLSDVKRLVNKTIEKFSRIDVLVNNAAVLTPIGGIQKIATTKWEDTLKVNLFGTFYCIKETVPHMVSQKSGKIINLSGGGAFKPLPNFSAYSTSKAAIVRLTETLAEELKEYNIQVNAIAPGSIKTKMTKDVLENRELAGKEYQIAKEVLATGGADLGKVGELATFLASDESDGLTGRTISAQWDDLNYIRKNIDEILESDKYTMKRIV